MTSAKQKSPPSLTLIMQNVNRPRSIHQYSNLAPRLSGQTSIFGVVFFCIQVSFGNWGTKETSNFKFDPKASEPCWNTDISNVAYLHFALSKRGLVVIFAGLMSSHTRAIMTDIAKSNSTIGHGSVDFRLDVTANDKRFCKLECCTTAHNSTVLLVWAGYLVNFLAKTKRN